MALNKDFKVKNGLTVTESLSVGGDSQVNALTATTFEALTAKFNKTIVSTTSALSVVNNGTGPALLVQQDGAQPIAHFIDKDGDDIIFHDDGKVSIGSRTAVEQLTVTGNISATGGIKVASTQNGFVSAGRDLADIFVTEAGGGGSVTNIRGCEGITVANGTSDACVTLDLTELPDMTQAFAGSDELIVLDDSTQKRKAANEIGVSVFNNDSNFVCNLGNLGIFATSTEINQLSTVTSDVQTQLSQLSSIKQDTINTTNRLSATNIGTGLISNEEFNFLDGVTSGIQSQLAALSSNAPGDITGITAGGGIKGGGSSGNVDVSIFPTQSAITSIKNTGLTIGRDDDNLIKFDANDQIVFRVGEGDGVTFKPSGEIEATSLDIEGNVDVNGSIETDGLSLSGTNVDASATEINQIHAITDGQVAANKAVVVNVDKDITGFNNITLAGELDAGSLHTDTVTVSEFNQLSNVSFDIQSQLGALSSNKLACTATAANSLLLGGCNSSTFEPALSPSNRLSATNIGTGLITNNEYNFLNGVDANIQTQLNQLSAGAGGGGTVTSITKGDGIQGSGDITTTGTIAVDPAQTTITSILATDLKIGEDDQTKIDFEDANAINFYADNAKQLVISDGALTPVVNNDIDLGTSDLQFKDGYFDGTLFADTINLNETNITATATEINQLDNVVVTPARFNQLSSVCFNIQTQLGKLSSSKLDKNSGCAADSAKLGGVLPAGYQTILTPSNRLSATNIGTGVVTNTEFNFLDGVTSGIQAQITAKQDTVDSSNRLDANLIGSGDVSDTEFNCLNGLTSTTTELNQVSSVTFDVQTQLAALSAGSGGCQGTVTTLIEGAGISISNCTTNPTICVNSTVVRTTGAQDIGGKKTFTDDTTITGNLSVLGAFTCIDTAITTTSALSVINAGTGPALFVQQDGSQPIAHFIDKNGDDIIFHDDGHLSIGTCTNCETLTVKDSISASNAVKSRCFVKDGGTNSQFLKGDGSVDSNSYLLAAGCAANSALLQGEAADAFQDTITTSARIGANCVGGGTVSNSEFNQLSSVCFNIQTQLGQLSSNKLAKIGCAADSAKLGGVLPAGYQTILTPSNRLSATNIGTGIIDNTEFNYLDGACFNIQSQLLALSSGAGGGGSVCQVTAGDGLGTDGANPITSTGTINIDAAQTTITSILATDLKIGEDDQTKIDFEDADTINFYANNEKQLILTNGALTPATNNDVDLGSDALEFKDGYFDGKLYADTINLNGTDITPTAAELNQLDNVVVPSACFNQLSSVTSPVQPQLQALSSNKLGAACTAVDSAKLGGVLPAGYQTILTPSNRLSATNIGTGTVTNDDFGFLANTDSNIQAQLNAKEPIISASNRIGADCINGGGVSIAEFNQLSSVTSPIQPQLQALSSNKLGAACTAVDSAKLGGVLPAGYQTAIGTSARIGANCVGDGTISDTEYGLLNGASFNLQSQLAALSSNKQATITGAATTITSTDLEDNRALITSSCKVAVSDITSTELNFLDGVSSNIQTQLAALSSGSGGCSGSVTSITAGSGLCGGTITNSGTISIDPVQTTLTSIAGTSLNIGRDSDNLIKFGTDNQIVFCVGANDGVRFKGSGEIEATSLDISGDVDVDGTLETDALSINGTTVTSTAAEINQLDNVVVPSACFNQLSSVTSPVQPQLAALSSNKLAKTGCAADSAKLGNVAATGYQTAIGTSARIGANCIGGGTVSNVEFNTLSSVTSNIQDQIDSKLATTGCAADSALLQGNNAASFQDVLTPSNRLSATNIGSGEVSNTEFNQLSSVTSNIQTQINSKLATTGCAADSALLQGNNAAYFQTAIGTSARIGANCIGANSNISNTEYGFLNGVSSNIQSQLAALSAGSGGTDGTVTSVVAGTGLAGGTITSSGTISIEAAQPTITSLGTLTSLAVDTFTIDGDSISTSGNAFIDAVGDIILDADGRQIFFRDGGTQIGTISMTDSNLKFISDVSDKDIIFAGTDGGSEVTALTLDMSDAGSASFNHDVTVAGDLTVNGDFTCKNTIVTITSALSVVNTGTGPALTVQQDGTQPIAHFIDKNGDDIIFHDDGHLSIGTRTNCETLTVKDSISASGSTKARCFVKFGGTSSQFLKADGSVDSTSYGTGSVCTLDDLGIDASAGEINQLDNVVIGGACFNQLSSVSSNVQTQIETKLATSGCAADSAKLGNVAAAGYQTAIGTSARIGANCIAGGSVSNTEFNQLSTVTSNIQTQINSKLATTGCAADSALLQGNNAAYFQTAIASDNKINADCIASGSVSNTEFNQLSTVTSNIQTQINSKLATTGCAADSALLQGNAASTFQDAIATDARIGANCIAGGSVSNTEFNQLSTVTSNIQTQINSKLATTGCAADSAKLGGSLPAAYQTAIGTSARIGANCIGGGTVSSTEFNALSTVTSNIQTQINSKLATTGCAADSALLQGNAASVFQTAIGTSARIGANCIGANSNISDTEYGFLNGVSSNIQTQLAALSAGSGGTDGTVTSVTAGTGMTQSGTNTINPTLNVIGGTGITANANDIALDLNELSTSTTDGDGDFFAVVDSSGNQKKLTKGNINNSGFNNDAGFATGTVTSVLGCTGITVTNGTGNACVNLTAAGAGAGTYGCTDDNIKIDTITLDAFGRITGVAVGNTGDINGVTAGVGLCGGGSSGSVTLTLDMSELTDMTADMVAADEFIVLDNGADRRKAACEIGLSIFDNDANFTSNTGDITSVVAGAGLTGGATSGDATLNVIAGTGICVTADAVCVDGTIVRTTGTQSIGGVKSFTSAMNATSITATGTVQAGCFVTGAFMESNAPADRVYPQGTILALNEDGWVVESTQADSSMVFGVAAGDNKAPIVMGAEPVCITGEIEVGDYITTSDCNGHGKKAICPDFKAFGAIIGQAMESGCGDSFTIKAMIRKM